MNSDEREKIAASEGEASNTDLDEAKRDTLRQLGTYGAYTAPALIAMLTADKAQAISSPPPIP